MIQQNDILTVNELAAILKVKPDWIRNHVRCMNPIPTMRFHKSLRFHWPDVAKWLETADHRLQ